MSNQVYRTDTFDTWRVKTNDTSKVLGEVSTLDSRITLTTLVFKGATANSFSVGNTVTGSVSGATATIDSIVGNVLTVLPTNANTFVGADVAKSKIYLSGAGDLTPGSTITGATSGVTAKVFSYNAVENSAVIYNRSGIFTPAGEALTGGSKAVTAASYDTIVDLGESISNGTNSRELETASKTAISSINELQREVGTIANLATAEKTNLVGALNEIKDSAITFNGAKTFSENLNLASTKVFTINGTSVLSATTLGNGVVNSSLQTVGTISLGTWQGTIVSPTYGGTGVSNGTRTITINNGSITLTTAGSAGSTSAVTVPSTGTLATLAGSEALTNKTYNGLGVTATTGTLTLANGKTLTVNNTVTFQSAADGSTITFPGSGGSVVYTSNSISALSTFPSSDLAGRLTDETGTGLVVFNTSPSLVTPTIGGAGANFSGSTSGTTILKAAAAAGSGTITMPTITGTMALTSDIGSGVITVTASTGLSGSTSFNVNQSGNTTITLTNTDLGSSQFIFKNVAVSGQTTVVADQNDDTLTLEAGGAITLTTNALTDTITFAHTDTSSQASVDNSNGFVIQDVTLDTYGHVTALGSVNLDLRYQPLDADLTAIAALTGTGFARRTGTDTWAIDTATYITASSSDNLTNKTYSGLTISATTGTLTITNAKTLSVLNTLTLSGTDGSTLNIGAGGTLGSAAYTAAGAYSPLAGSTSLVTLGTVTTGTWNATSIGTAYTDAKITTVTGTANQVLVNGVTTAQTGALTLTLPQNIHTGATPTFSGLTVSRNQATGSPVVVFSISNPAYVSPAVAERFSIKSDGSVVIEGNLSVTGQAAFTSTTYTPGWSTITGKPAPTYTVALAGDVTGTANSGAVTVGDNASISVTATLANSGVTAGTYTKVTVNAKGLVTTGATLTAGDIPSLSYLSSSTTSTQGGYFGDIFLYDDTSPSHYLGITNAANLTAARTLSLNVNDADRTISLSGNLTVSASATVSGTNTGDQTITLTGDITGSGTGSFVTTLPNQSGLTGGTYTKVTVNTKGLVTAGTTLSAGDIPALAYLSNATNSTQNGYFNDVFLWDTTNPSHYLGINNSSDLTAARTLSINVNDADRTISLSGNLTVSAAATVSGTNTGDQTITLTGDVTGTGTGSFATSIAAGAVVEAKIGAGAVTSTKIGDGAVIEAKIGTGAVTTTKIADLNVTTAKIADGNVTNAKLASGIDIAKLSAYTFTVNGSSGLSAGGTANIGGAISLTNTDRGSDQLIFKTIAVSGQTSIAANANSTTLTIAAGQVDTTSGITLATDNTTKTLTISHTNTSSQASVDNSNGIVIQDVTLDTYGHVTGLGSVDLDSRYVRLSPGGAQTIGGNVTITGDLTVSGTTTTVNSTTVEIADLNILLAKNATTAAAANGAGFTIGAITGGSPTMLYTNSSDRFVFNRGIEGSSIVRTGGTSSQFLKADGTIDSTSYLPSANAAASVANALTIGTGLGGVSYNGSSAVTITNTDKGSDQNIFKNVALSGTGTNSITCAADTNNDTLTLSASSTSGISISADATTDTITFTNTGVTGITANLVPSGGSFGGAGTINFTGTANQVHLNSSGSTLTFSAPQNIHTGATPTFAGMTLSGLTGYLKANGGSALTASSTIPSTDISNSTFVDLSTSQAASGVKTFNNAVLCKESLEIHNFNLVNGLWFMKSDSTYPYRVILTGNNISHLIGGTSVYTLLFQNNNGSLSLKANGTVEASSTVQATGFKTASGTSAQFLKADGSVDSTTYLTSAVTSLTGTTNQVTVSASTGAVTLSLPQNISTTSSPTFFGATLTGLAGYVKASASGALGTLTASTTVPWSDVSGAPSFLTTAVTSLTGTTNQVTVSASTGSVTLSLPQSIHTGATVQFDRLGIGSGGTPDVMSGLASGEIRARDNITAYYASDERLKTNIKKIDNALEKVSQIDGVIYDWNEQYKNDHGGVDGYFIRNENSGVIAQQVEKVFPNVVADRSNGFKAVRYELLVPLLIEAIKDLKAEIEALKAQK